METIQTSIAIASAILFILLVFILIPIRFFAQRGMVIGILDKVITVILCGIIGGIIGLGIISFFFIK